MCKVQAKTEEAKDAAMIAKMSSELYPDPDQAILLKDIYALWSVLAFLPVTYNTFLQSQYKLFKHFHSMFEGDEKAR